jgi:hypothetical protein
MSEKDYIEKIISDNLEKLNDNEPRDGHFDRFEAKLKSHNRRKIISLSMVLKVAAAVVFVLLAANQAFIYFSSDEKLSSTAEENNRQNVSLASVAPEYEEVEFYYNNAINVGLNQWESMVEIGLISDEEQNLMDKELDEFGNVYESLRKDLEANPNDERVINAMLEYYQTKLSVINMIVNKLEEVKQKNNTTNETEM